MKVNRIVVTVEPEQFYYETGSDRYYNYRKSLKVQVQTDKENYEVDQAITEENDLECMFDIMMDTAKRELKEALKGKRNNKQFIHHTNTTETFAVDNAVSYIEI